MRKKLTTISRDGASKVVNRFYAELKLWVGYEILHVLINSNELNKKMPVPVLVMVLLQMRIYIKG